MTAAEDHGWKRIGGRQPTKEERALWRQIVQDATPLHPENRRREPATAPNSAEAEVASKPVETAKSAKLPPAAVKKAAEVKSRAKALDEGRLTEMDRRTAERFRRGRLPIEARLDLHGMTRTAAHEALDAFVARCSARELRCVLVITGKGTFSAEGGVLRREVPRWLNLPGTRGKVLAFTSAQRQHGGGGAFYLLLRRHRG